MKICLAEAIKRVKALDTEVREILGEENSKCETVYRTPEEKITYDYDFIKTRNEIKTINEEILALKRAINKANNETDIGISGYTIADGLVAMALINKELQYHLEMMGRKEQLTSKVDARNDSIIYTELLYDPKECRKYVAEQRDLLAKIQMGIDRANLTTFIEY
ncbi:MAG: hypothetical protein J6J36_02725 [Clostridia bacterium]|nr:hypothetical protein [Clostridia bacterium]